MSITPEDFGPPQEAVEVQQKMSGGIPFELEVSAINHVTDIFSAVRNHPSVLMIEKSNSSTLYVLKLGESANKEKRYLSLFEDTLGYSINEVFSRTPLDMEEDWRELHALRVEKQYMLEDTPTGIKVKPQVAQLQEADAEDVLAEASTLKVHERALMRTAYQQMSSAEQQDFDHFLSLLDEARAELDLDK